MRLPRPSIPVEVKIRVVLAQLGEMWISEVIEQHRGSLVAFLDHMLGQLAVLLDCEIKDLRLDHNPALALREKIRNSAGAIVGYRPDANDPEFMIYRSSHAHYIKTNVRGDGAQHSDRVLIKRDRRRERKKKKNIVNRDPSRHRFGATGKSRSSRKTKNWNRWPPKGVRKFLDRVRETKLR